MIDTIINSFDIWTDAQGIKSRTRIKSVDNISLNGIAQLRSLILDFAIKGILVPQNTDEESAIILLKRIEKENQQLIKDGKIKESKNLLEITEKEKMFELPVGWSWVRFGNISLIERGGSPRPIESFITNDSDGLNWIKIGDTEIGGKYITSTREKIRKEGLIKTRMVYPGDFLLTNSMSFGRPYITKIEGCIHDGWLRIHPPISLNKDYLYHLLSSSYVANFFRVVASGAVVLNLNADKVRLLPIPIPPLDEQSRIVSKVDELMSLCDKIEVEQLKNLKTHQILVKTLLETITRASDAKELETSWRQIADNFDTLFRTDDSIEQLKQTILQLAVMGKLVKQDDNDEPASELLKKIAEEKERLVKEGKIKKQAHIFEMSKDEIPFEIPTSWEWCRLQNLAIYIQRGKGPKYSLDGKVQVVSQKCVQWSGFDLSHAKYIQDESIKDYQKERFLQNNDLLWNSTGTGTVGRIIVLNNIDSDSLVADSHVTVIRPIFINSRFLFNFLASQSIQQRIEPSSKNALVSGTTNQVELNTSSINSILIPVPSISEQLQIIERVDELFAQCDILKEKIKKSEEIKLLLSKTIFEKAVK